MSGADLSQKMAVVLTERLQTELMSCEEVVATGRYPYTGRFGILTPEDNKVVEEAMELVHVTEIRDRDFRCISDGQRQRVMLARALCQEPDIIVLGADSVDVVELIMSVEDAFEVGETSEEVVSTLKTVGDVVNYIASKVAD